MNVVQSFYSVVLRSRLSLYEIRILLAIVERCNEGLRGTPASRHISEVLTSDGINYNFAIQIREILTDDSHHYDLVKSAALSLMSKIIEHDNAKLQKWSRTPIIYNCIMEEGSGTLRFSASKWFCDLILDFSKGFSRYNLTSAMRLTSTYSARMYMLVSSMSAPLVLTIDYLKSMFGVDGVNETTKKPYYAQTRDFIKRVVEPSKTELDKEGINSFKFEEIREGNKITALRIIPIKNEQMSKSELAAQASLSAWCNPALRSYLITQCGFSSRELSAHKSLLFEFGKRVTWQDEILVISERARRKRAGKGYYINSIKSIINNV